MNGAVRYGLRCGWPPLVLLAAALAATGCASARYVNFRPVGSHEGAGANWVAKRTYHVPPESRDVKVQVAARGRTEENERGVMYDTLHVSFRIENGGKSAFSLDPGAVKLLDDEGGVVAGAEAYAGRNRTGTITIAGGARGAYELVFDLPADNRLENVGSLRLAWPYRYGDKDYEVATKFIKIEQVNYYYSPRYYYDPWHYDPWHYDPWYGPWGRRHFGLGYYQGW